MTFKLFSGASYKGQTMCAGLSTVYIRWGRCPRPLRRCLRGDNDIPTPRLPYDSALQAIDALKAL